MTGTTAEGMQEEKTMGWGGSKPVPSVQELVRNDSQDVPQRYIKKQEDRPLDYRVFPVEDEIPIISLGLLASGDEDERKKLHSVCKDWGFFQIIDHGVDDKVLHDMKAAVAAFFELPLEEKKMYAMPENDLQGYGQAYVVSDQQQLDWNDLIFLMIQPIKYRNMKYWPTKLPNFKNAVEDYSTALEKVTIEILANLSVLMGMERDSLIELHMGIQQGMRMNYYPTCTRPDLVLGVSPHSDSSSFTILLQDDEITALQVKHNGGWVPLKPVPNALVVNIGDAMEVWSNGVYKSIEHRAVTNSKRARISVATFIMPDGDVIIGPLETMFDDHSRPKIYRNMKYEDYLRYTLSRKMDGKAHTEFMKLSI